MYNWFVGRNGFGAVLMVGVFLLAMGVAGRAWAQATPEQRHLLSVVRIWDQAPHNAFTDLVEVDGTLYCVFREGTGHVPGAAGTNGSVRVLASSDGQNWRSVALLIEPGMDLRDPKISRMPDGRRLLLMEGSIYEGERLIRNRTGVSFGTISTGGVVFSALVPVEIDAAIPNPHNSLWLWRVTWHDGVGYDVAYRTRHPPIPPLGQPSPDLLTSCHSGHVDWWGGVPAPTKRSRRSCVGSHAAARSVLNCVSGE
jgi:hypothetical protein